MELEPAFVDVAVRRSEAFTGKKAALLSNGRLFEAVAAERLAAPEGASRADKKISLTYERAREHVKVSRRKGVFGTERTYRGELAHVRL